MEETSEILTLDNPAPITSKVTSIIFSDIATETPSKDNQQEGNSFTTLEDQIIKYTFTKQQFVKMKTLSMNCLRVDKKKQR